MIYDIFGFPSDDVSGGERVVIALSFAAAPDAGVFVLVTPAQAGVKGNLVKPWDTLDSRLRGSEEFWIDL